MIMKSTINPTVSIVTGCVGENEKKQSTGLLLGALLAILNLVEIVMIGSFKRKKKIYDIILLSLSVSDCTFGLSNVFLNIAALSKKCESEALSEATHTFYVFSILSSILHLIFITIDRLITVLKPLQHKIYFTRKKIYITLAFLWILAIIVSTILQLLDEFTETFKNFQEKMQLTLSIIIIIADMVMITSYSLILYQVNFKRKVSSTQKKSSKLSLVCIATVVTFVLLTLPYAITRILTGQVPFWANVILVTNSGMNSVVYFLRSEISKFWQVRMKKYFGRKYPIPALPSPLASSLSTKTGKNKKF